MSVARGLVTVAVVLSVLCLFNSCGGVSTTVSVSQTLAPSLSLTSDSDPTTGAADGYVYIPVVSVARQTSLIVLSVSPTPPEGYEAAAGAQVELTSGMTAVAARAVTVTGYVDSRGHYVFFGLEPDSYTLTITLEGFSFVPLGITIAADSVTHGGQQPSATSPAVGFKGIHVDLTTNAKWLEVQDRIEGVEDIQFSFSATNQLGADQPATLDLFVSLNDALTGVNINDGIPDDPEAFQVYSLSLPYGTGVLISSNADNTVAENQQTFKDQVRTGDFNLYFRLFPYVEGAQSISNPKIKITLRLSVI